MKRVALCMRGAVSKEKPYLNKNELYMSSEYIDYKQCYNSIVKHIIEPNSKNYSIDVFCHCWNEDIKNDIIELYQPVKYLFEDNRNYNEEIEQLCRLPTDFSGISQALTIKKSIELKEQYESEHNIMYDIVILYRYDVLLWKDIVLSNYTDLDNKIYVNAHPEKNGDFHFVMNQEKSTKFKNLYNSINLGNRYVVHYWIQNYIVNYMRTTLVMDDIIPGEHQEVLRKIYEFSINKGYLSLDKFNSYK
jgi:hypothetical protein